MAINSGQIDLNSDVVLHDRENNEVIGFKASVSDGNACVSHSHSETLGGDLVVGGGGDVNVGDDVGTDGCLEPFSCMNPGCDIVIDGNEGFGEDFELVGLGNELDIVGGVEAVDGGCNGKEGEFSCDLMMNEGMVFEYNDGVVPDKGMVFEYNDDVQNELEGKNAIGFAKNGFPSYGAISNSVAQGVDDNLSGWEKEAANAALVNLSAVLEDEGKMNVADSLVTKDGLEDSHILCASEVAAYQLQGGIPYMEDLDVNAGEPLQVKVFSGNHLELETSNELKEAAFQVGAKVDAMQNQTICVDIAGVSPFENVQNECYGLNLVVDLNSYGNMQVGMYREPVVSELNFRVSDLVWGKVMGHPWWPGLIVDPSAASETAKRHFKKDSHLIAYFGDQTFAWNDVSMIKPFRMYFSQMEKQGNLESFHHAVDRALDEVSRRVEFGLSCPCMPEDTFSKLKTQVISNAGILRQSSRINGGDRFTNAMSFEPLKLVYFVKSFAQSPLAESDRLDFVIARAQLSAFYRSKGYFQLPEFTVLGGLFQSNEQCDEVDLTTHNGYTQKCKQPNIKHRLLSDLMYGKSLCVSNGEHILEWEASDKPIPRRRGRKRKTPYSTPEDYSGNSQTQTQLHDVSTIDLWYQLCWAAKDPDGENFSTDIIHFFAEFRKSTCLDHSVSMDQGMSVEPMHDGDTVPSTEAMASMTSAMEPCNDSYWTDRIIQSVSGEQSFSKPSKAVEQLHESSEENSSPTALTLKFTSFDSIPSTTDLIKIFSRFGPLIKSKTELLKKSNRARVVFRRRVDAETAFSSAGKYSIFGPSLVCYKLKILPHAQPKDTGKRGRKSKKETSSMDGAALI